VKSTQSSVRIYSERIWGQNNQCHIEYWLKGIRLAPFVMCPTRSFTTPLLIAGRLALDFANTASSPYSLSWEGFISFLTSANVVTEDRAKRLRSLPQTEPEAVAAVLNKILRLRESLLTIFAAIVRKKAYPKAMAEPINEILRITEGHDELIQQGELWRLQYIAREEGLEWLLAAIARSAAELLVEGPDAPIRRCANPKCRLFFYDDSRTHRRRWCSMAVCGNRHKVAAFLQRKPIQRNPEA
jgi:predicted RNA-binding Zn ribbon-like protein